MNKHASLLIGLVLLGACASEPSEPADDVSVSDADAASPPQPAQSVALSELEGLWERDDRAQYHLVVHEGRLIGYRLNSDYFGCRVMLEQESDTLRGGASFATYREEADSLLKTSWELRAVDSETLEGTLGAWDLDPETGRYTIQSEEAHRFERRSTFSADEAEAVRAVSAVHLVIDEVLGSEAPREGVVGLMSSPQVQALEDNPLRESVGVRLQALFRSLAPTSLQAGSPRSAEAPDEAGAAEEAAPVVAEEPADQARAASAAHSAHHEEEMRAFLALFTGKCEAVEEALQRFGVAGLDAKEMDYYDLSEPAIVSSEADRFTFEAKAGMTIRTYVVTWKSGRIVEVESRGLR